MQNFQSSNNVVSHTKVTSILKSYPQTDHLPRGLSPPPLLSLSAALGEYLPPLCKIMQLSDMPLAYILTVTVSRIIQGLGLYIHNVPYQH
jgi:hypothetical protein